MFGFCKRFSMEHHRGAVFISTVGGGDAVVSVLVSAELDVETAGWVVSSPGVRLFEDGSVLDVLVVGEVFVSLAETRRG